MAGTKRVFSDLERAAFQGNMKGVRDILNGNWVQDDLNKALHAAVRKNYTEIVEFLLEHDADVTFRDKLDERTPLMIASKNSYLDIMRLLLQYRSKMEAIDKFGDTPLILCLKNHNQSGANILIKHGAKTKVTDKRGNTCLHLAAEGGYAGTVEYLIKKGVGKKDLNKALHAAVHKNNTEIVELLLQHGASVKFRDEFANSTALMIASKSSCVSSIRLLLKHGSELEVRDKFGDTPLMLGLENQNKAGAILLIEHGADTTVTDKQGNTCLHLAADGGCAEAVDHFIKRGVDVNAVNTNFNSTALHKAANGCKTDVVGSNYLHIINSLLDANCDTSIQTNEGYTAFLLALTNNFSSFKHKQICIDARGNEYEPNRDEEYRPQNITFQRLLSATENFEAGNNLGETALMLAAKYGYQDWVQTLIEKGCIVYKRSNSGWTALKFAKAGGHKEVVQLLLDNSVDDDGIP